jgi:hypothetical protein
VTPVLAGALADFVTGPAMVSDTWMSRAFGWAVGTSPGSGLALQYVVAGALYCLTCLLVLFFVPAVRHLDTLVPDHDAKLPEASSQAGSSPAPENV